MRFSSRFCEVLIVDGLLVHLLCWVSWELRRMGFLLLWQNTMNNSNLERNRFISSCNSQIYSVTLEARAETQGRNWSKVTEACCLQACASWLAQPFLDNSEPLTQGGITHNGLGPPYQSVFKKLPICESYIKTASQLRPLCPDDCSLCQVTKSSQHTRLASILPLSYTTANTWGMTGWPGKSRCSEADYVTSNPMTDLFCITCSPLIRPVWGSSCQQVRRQSR